MSNYAYVENGEIKRLEDNLPENWNNISNFYHAKDNNEFINLHGWYKIISNIPEYDSKLKYIESYEYEIFDDHIVKTANFVDIAQPSTEELRTQFMKMIRDRRNKLLSDSDWTQVLDIQNIKSDEWKNSWVIYRQELRDFPEYCISLEIVDDLDSLPWPIVPV
jgi:hypothetical protein